VGLRSSKLIIGASFLIVFATCNHDSIDKASYKVTIDTITKNRVVRELYKIHEQFMTNCDSANFASVYVCTKIGSTDTILVISPCPNDKFKKNTEANVIIEKDIVEGRTLTVEIPVRYLHFLNSKKSRIFGRLFFPVEAWLSVATKIVRL